MEVNLETFYPHHDLLVELGKVEMAMETLDERVSKERDTLRPILASRLTRLREVLVRVAACRQTAGLARRIGRPCTAVAQGRMLHQSAVRVVTAAESDAPGSVPQHALENLRQIG
jgi:hypothetical protein